MRNGRGQQDGTEFSPRQLYIGPMQARKSNTKLGSRQLPNMESKYLMEGSHTIVHRGPISQQEALYFLRTTRCLSQDSVHTKGQVRVVVEHLWPSSAHLTEGGNCLFCRIRHHSVTLPYAGPLQPGLAGPAWAGRVFKHQVGCPFTPDYTCVYTPYSSTVWPNVVFRMT